MSYIFTKYVHVGEFSLVYKASLLNKDGEQKDVAVKALKGIIYIVSLIDDQA